MITATFLAAIEAANEREAERRTVEQQQSVKAFRADALRVFGSELFELFPRFKFGTFGPLVELIDDDDDDAVSMRRSAYDEGWWKLDAYGRSGQFDTDGDISRNFDRLLIAIGDLLSAPSAYERDDNMPF